MAVKEELLERSQRKGTQHSRTTVNSFCTALLKDLTVERYFAIETADYMLPLAVLL